MTAPNAGAAAVRRAGWLALAASALTLGLIAYGSWVRVSGSGLGCPDWPLCEGVLIPEIEGARAIEFGHRAYAGVVVLIIAASAFVAYRARSADRLTSKLLVWALAVVLAQAVLGGITVLTELHGMVRLAHLTFSMATLALLTAGAARALDARLVPPPNVRRWTALAVAAGFVVLAGGAIVGTGQSAGCPGLPLCDSRSSMEAMGVHSVHRIGATLLLLALVWTAWQARAAGGWTLRMSALAAALAGAQVAVGVSAVWLELPQYLRVLHLALAAAVWWAVVAQMSFALIGQTRR